MKLITLIILIFIFYLFKNNEKDNFSNINNNKYIVLIFSDNKGKPSKNFKPKGFGGLRHNEIGYLQRLPLVAKYLNRKAVLTPPWISLQQKHNNNKAINKDNNWSSYFNIDNIDNLEKNPPFSFSNNGDIITKLSVNYYPSNTPLNKMNNEVDIIVLVNYYDKVSGLKTYSYISFNEINNYPQIKYSTSDLLKNYANNIISKLNLNKFTFIHIRRGDFLNNKVLAPPKGTLPYTSPSFVANFIKSKIKNKNIVIATNETDPKYKKKLLELLNNYNLIFEDKYFEYLPDNIKNDNYSIYLISNEIANKAEINIGTHGYVRLGKKYHYRLSDFQ